MSRDLSLSSHSSEVQSSILALLGKESSSVKYSVGSKKIDHKNTSKRRTTLEKNGFDKDEITSMEVIKDSQTSLGNVDFSAKYNMESKGINHKNASMRHSIAEKNGFHKEDNTSLEVMEASQASLGKEGFTTKYMGSKGMNHKNDNMRHNTVEKNGFDKKDSTSMEILEDRYHINDSSQINWLSAVENPNSFEKVNTVKGDNAQEQNYSVWNKSSCTEDIKNSIASIPKCIPPWAKTLRNKYGYAPSGTAEYTSEESKINIKDKIENLMKKHSELMLVKRVNSRKQLILEPNKNYDNMDVVKMRARNTKYYMTPLTKSGEKQLKDGLRTSGSKRTSETLSVHEDNNSMSVTKKTSKVQVKREISNVLKSLNKTTNGQALRRRVHENRTEQDKCLKVTPSKIREFIKVQTMDPDERRLHEVIKVEKVPIRNAQDIKRLDSKYIINLPQNKSTDKSTINTIKIKEKRKLKLHNIEDINEKVTEFQYTQGKTKQLRRKQHIAKECSETADQLNMKTMSPTETTTFQVISENTPLITPLIEEKKHDKVLLIQYEKKSKPSESRTADGKPTYKTHLIGVNENCEDTGEMYLYGTETVGTKTKEQITKANEIPVSLKDKVNQIFKELMEIKFKPEPQTEQVASATQISPEVRSKEMQHSSQLGTEVAMVQAVPEVRSAEVQVRQSLLTMQEDLTMTVPHPSYITSESDIVAKTDRQNEKAQEDLFMTIPHPSYVTSELDTKSNTNIQNKDVKPTNKITAKPEGFDDLLQQKIQDLDDGKKEEAVTESEETFIGDLEENYVMDEDKEGDQGIEEREEEYLIQSEVAEEVKSVPESKESDGAGFAEGFEEPEENKYILQMSEKAQNQYEPTVEKSLPQKKVETSISKLVKVTPIPSISEVSNNSKGEREKLEKSVENKISDDEIELQFVEDDVVRRHEDVIRSYEFDQTSISKLVKVTPTTSILEMSNDSKLQEEKLEVSVENKTDNDEKGLQFVKEDTMRREEEDIRRFEFGKTQDAMMDNKSSTKFHHDRDQVRTCMNWTWDTIYLEKQTCPQLVRGLAETALKRPADPISFLAHWIYKDCANREQEEHDTVFQEHLQLARTMLEVTAENKLPRKFNTKHYPVRTHTPELEQEDLNQLIEEDGKNEFQSEIVQDV